MASPIQPTPAPSKLIEGKLYDLANSVALRYAKLSHWSSFHSYDAVVKSDSSKPLPTDDKAFWEALVPFDSCLGISTLVYHILRDAVSSHTDPEVSKHADMVQLMTCSQYAKSETQYHAVVGLCFDKFAFVIDHFLHPSAFKVPLRGEFAMFAYLPLFSSIGQDRFKYFLTSEGTYVLTMSNYIPGDSWALSFTPQDVPTTIAQLAIPAASETKPLKDDADILLHRANMSPSAHCSMNSQGMRVQVDFGDPALLMQIPRADWLERLQCNKWARITEYEGYIEKSEATSHVFVKLSARTNDMPTQREQKQIVLLGALVAEFGMDPKVIQEMTASIFRAWELFRVPIVLTAPRCVVESTECY